MKKYQNEIEAFFCIVLFAALVFVAGYFAGKQYDKSYENRAKAAGYYDNLPDEMKNPKDINK